MKVYRFLSEDELMMYFSGKTEEVGHCYKNAKNKNVNSFYYKPNTKYVHFYKRLKDIRHIKEDIYRHHKDEIENDKNPKRFYIACFDIPFKLLSKNSGRGRYIKIHEDKGYVTEKSAVEYALESKLLKEEYLIYFKQEKLDKYLHWQKDEMDKEI